MLFEWVTDANYGLATYLMIKTQKFLVLLLSSKLSLESSFLIQAFAFLESSKRILSRAILIEGTLDGVFSLIPYFFDWHHTFAAYSSFSYSIGSACR